MDLSNDELKTVRDIHISVVSHHHGKMLLHLLQDLSQYSCRERLQVTLVNNINDPFLPDMESLPFPVKIIANETPQGFGANHNKAFSNPPLPLQRKYFLVINPDVRMVEDAISPLIKVLAENEKSGVVAPTVVNSDGLREDSARALPTFKRLLFKLLGQRDAWQETGDETFYPDWVAGMFMLFDASVYQRLGGFDERYFLYYEDVDLCSRLWLNNYTVRVERQIKIIHDAQRTSHQQLKFLYWHLSSILFFLSSRVYRKVKKLHQVRAK